MKEKQKLKGNLAAKLLGSGVLSENVLKSLEKEWSDQVRIKLFKCNKINDLS